MRKTVSALAAVAMAVTAVPATMAVVAAPQAANAAVRVVVRPSGGYFYNGRHYRNRVWRGGRWAYADPIIVAGPIVVGGGGYMYGGRRWGHRTWECHRNMRRQVCKYRYW